MHRGDEKADMHENVYVKRYGRLSVLEAEICIKSIKMSIDVVMAAKCVGEYSINTIGTEYKFFSLTKIRLENKKPST